MRYREVTGGREFLLTLQRGGEWCEEIATAAAEATLAAGWFTATGAVRDATLRHYDPREERPRSVEFDGPLAVAACAGPVVRREADPDEEGPEPVWEARPRVVLARRSGQALAGVLERASVLEGDCHLRGFEDLAATDDREAAPDRAGVAAPDVPDDPHEAFRAWFDRDRRGDADAQTDLDGPGGTDGG